MNLEIFWAHGIASSATVSTLDSYEDEIDWYRDQSYTYIPIPEEEKYYHVLDEELRDIKPGQYYHPDTPMMTAFEQLQEYPFLLYDEFKRFDLSESYFEPNGYDTLGEGEGAYTYPYVAKHPLEVKEVIRDVGGEGSEVMVEIVDTIVDMDRKARFHILTLADANKRRARELFYRVISEFEVQLAQLVKQEYPDSEELFADAKPEAIGRWQKSKLDDLVVHISEYMYLSTLQKIVGKTESLRSQLGYTSRNQFDNDLGGMIELRNKIMHPTQTLVHNREDLANAVSRVKRTLAALEELDAPTLQPPIPEDVATRPNTD
ncbi:hypothetical protein ACFQL9_13115 [Halobaculum lipolyticum]|uniref:Apea-like HEPN domain-containing protein n=1 Tax=Halobaculum lipolyticum TaxID=3032001 RepID=A0ABD5WFA9_9EURY